MKKQRKAPKRNCYWICLTGIALALLVTTIAVVVLSAMLLNNHMDENRILYVVPAIQFVSVLLAAYITCKRYGQKYILTALAVGGGYLLLLIAATLLLFDCSFERLGQGGLVCLLATIIASILCLLRRAKTLPKKHRL